MTQLNVMPSKADTRILDAYGKIKLQFTGVIARQKWEKPLLEREAELEFNSSLEEGLSLGGDNNNYIWDDQQEGKNSAITDEERSRVRNRKGEEIEEIYESADMVAMFLRAAEQWQERCNQLVAEREVQIRKESRLKSSNTQNKFSNATIANRLRSPSLQKAVGVKKRLSSKEKNSFADENSKS